MAEKMTYAGFNQDTHGITTLGRIVLDAWLFELLPREEDCTGWDLQRMQDLMEQVNRLGRVRQSAQQPARPTARAPCRTLRLGMRRGRERGWDPELDEDE